MKSHLPHLPQLAPHRTHHPEVRGMPSRYFTDVDCRLHPGCLCSRAVVLQQGLQRSNQPFCVGLFHLIQAWPQHGQCDCQDD